MKSECGHKTCLEQTEGVTRTNHFTRAFGWLVKSSANEPRSWAISAVEGHAEVAQAFQLEAEQKRALGIANCRRDIVR